MNGALRIRLQGQLSLIVSTAVLATSVAFASNTPVKTAQAPADADAVALESGTHPESASAIRVPAGNPGLKSGSALVIDEQSGTVLYSRNAQTAGPIASITKLMTALVVLEADQPLDEILEITSADRDTIHGSGSRLAPGTKLSRGDLMHLALMSSENRAAHALGRNYPGGLPAFVKAMNLKARGLGMKSARFSDPTGLSSQNVCNAVDLGKLVLAASSDPIIRRFSTDEKHTVTVRRQPMEFRNTNALVRKSDWDIELQKTGYTSDAGECLVMKTLIEKRPVVIVLLNSFGKLTRVADARRVRKWMEKGSEPARLARNSR
jgi:serine-type D-Ala-D-Ala endopeptidase (penicillin-binding protein 7)